MNYKSYIDILSALLTPLIAIIAIYIAYQQHKTNKIRLQRDLFEKHFAFYKELMSFIVMAKLYPITDEQMSGVNSVFMEAEFLFPKSISAHVNDIHMKAITKRGLEREKEKVTGEKVDELDNQLSEIAKWFNDQITPTHRKFKKYLKLR